MRQRLVEVGSVGRGLYSVGLAKMERMALLYWFVSMTTREPPLSASRMVRFGLFIRL